MLKKDFRDECFEKTMELVDNDRMYNPESELYVRGIMSAEGEVAHGTDTDYRMLYEIDSHGKKTPVRGSVTLPNDEKETADGPAYVCKQLVERLSSLRIMNTALGVRQTKPRELEIYERK